MTCIGSAAFAALTDQDGRSQIARGWRKRATLPTPASKNTDFSSEETVLLRAQRRFTCASAHAESTCQQHRVSYSLHHLPQRYTGRSRVTVNRYSMDDPRSDYNRHSHGSGVLQRHGGISSNPSNILRHHNDPVCHSGNNRDNYSRGGQGAINRKPGWLSPLGASLWGCLLSLLGAWLWWRRRKTRQARGASLEGCAAVLPLEAEEEDHGAVKSKAELSADTEKTVAEVKSSELSSEGSRHEIGSGDTTRDNSTEGYAELAA